MEPSTNPAPSVEPTEAANTPAKPYSPNAPVAPDPKGLPGSKPSRAPIWCLGIIAIISITAAAIFAYLYFTYPAPTPAPQNNCLSPAQPAEPTSDDEVEITDTNLLQELDRKMAILHNTTETGPFLFKRGMGLGYSMVYPLYSGEGLSNLARLVHVANSIEGDHIVNSVEMQAIIDKTGYTNIAKEFERGDMKAIERETLFAKYLDTYGEEFDEESIVNQRYCPTYYYEPTYDFYYGPITGCGGTGPYNGLYYKNKYTTDDEHAYVYVSVGTFNEEDYNIYCGLITKDSYPSICEESRVPLGYPDDDDYVIDATNYQKYAQYRFVFNKADNGSYYFSKVEKL